MGNISGSAGGAATTARSADEKKAKWTSAFAECKPTLLSLANADNEGDRLGARAWWVVCMAVRCGGCTEEYKKWKGELPTPQLRVEDTQAAVSLPSFNPMAECVIREGREVGVEVSQTLDTTEAFGQKMQGEHAQRAWGTAVGGIEPARRDLISKFLPNGPAPQRQQMSINELRVCQIWLYGLATRLAACQGDAKSFASAIQLPNPESPFEGYQEEKWDPQSKEWIGLESCVRHQAAKAGQDTSECWRSGAPTGPAPPT